MSQNRPVKTFRVGRIEASVWQNETQKDGQTIVKKSVRIQKSFRDDKGDYQKTDYYFPDDLPKLALAAQKAFEYIAVREN